jgi:hypothetical protein
VDINNIISVSDIQVRNGSFMIKDPSPLDGYFNIENITTNQINIPLTNPFPSAGYFNLSLYCFRYYPMYLPDTLKMEFDNEHSIQLLRNVGIVKLTQATAANHYTFIQMELKNYELKK